MGSAFPRDLNGVDRGSLSTEAQHREIPYRLGAEVVGLGKLCSRQQELWCRKDEVVSLGYGYQDRHVSYDRPTDVVVTLH